MYDIKLIIKKVLECEEICAGKNSGSSYQMKKNLIEMLFNHFECLSTPVII